MANNKLISNVGGTPFTAATDEIAGVDYAKMKLFSSEEDSAEGIGDDDKGTQRALWVSNKSDLVLPSTPVNSAGLTIAATPYAVGDVVGNGWVIPNAARAAGGYGRVELISLFDAADVAGVIVLWFATGSMTFGTDNSPLAIAAANGPKLIGKQSIALDDMGSCRFGVIDSISMPYVVDGTDLYVYATTNTVHNQFLAVTDLKLRVGLVRE